MKAVFTSAALADLDDILSYTLTHYPSLVPSLQDRIRAVIERIEQWPDSAREVRQRPGIRMVPLIRYPYRLFYRVAENRIEILHIRHAARDDIAE
jgi:toxin ParE1/3/4